MKFSEYYVYFDNENQIIETITKRSKEYLSDLLVEQTVSVGKPLIIKTDKENLSVKHDDVEKVKVDIESYKLGTSLCLEVTINNKSCQILISPLYFDKENIKNYLLECEIEIKRCFSEIRKSIKK